jgi:hypothetical protein
MVYISHGYINSLGPVLDHKLDQENQNDSPQYFDGWWNIEDLVGCIVEHGINHEFLPYIEANSENISISRLKTADKLEDDLI